MPSRPARAWFIAVVVIAILILAGWFLFKDRIFSTRPDPAAALMRESAKEAGITFHMSYLPFEQGEQFKINLYDHGAGIAVGDIDGDGHDDVYFLNQLGPNALYRNKGDGTFEDVTERAGVGLGDRVCVAAAIVDYDNDGLRDIYVTSTRGGNVLFRNLGAGAFKDVTQEANLKHVGHSQAPLFFDFDNDGLLDLFLTNTAEWTTDVYDDKARYYLGKGGGGIEQVVHSPKERNVLYHNLGNGKFEDVTEQAGVRGRGWAGDAIAFDYDGDGRMDILVTSMFGRAQLYRNEDGKRFTDVTLEVLGQTPWGGLGASLLDYNNDGKLDLFIVDMHSDMWMGPDYEHVSLPLARKHEKTRFHYYSGPHAETDKQAIPKEIELGRQIGFRHEDLLFGNAFYRNDGAGKFSEISGSLGLETFWPWGIAAGDFDNDGLVDAFLPSGMGYPFYYWPNYLMMNRGGAFVDQAKETGIEPPAGGQHLPKKVSGKPATRSSRSAGSADFDGDGRLEIVVNNFNDHPYLFKNQFPKKNYIALRLQGTKSNRDAIGAVVRLHQGKKIMTRQVQGTSGYLSQSSATIHFGLGDQSQIDRIEITWPSGIVQDMTGLEANRRHDVIEAKNK